MRGNKSADTRPEQALRSALHRRGLRFRKGYSIQANDLSVKADIAFPRLRLAVFVDGCFWHACPTHGRVPNANSSYWRPKLARNVARDQAVVEALHARGWTVLRLWEHVPLEEAIEQVIDVVAGQWST